MNIKDHIYIIRGHKVLLDSDLAKLYGVTTKSLNQQVRRNIDRFPDDFMFQLSDIEYDLMWSQFVTTSEKKRRKSNHPLVFTENGVAMLSSVLKSKEAIQVNIAIMRLFTKLRNYYALEESINKRIDKFEEETTKVFKLVFEKLDKLEPVIDPKRRKIGFTDN